jgi:hypothetical protein
MNYKLFFANLPDDITEEQVNEICATYGKMVFLSLVNNEETASSGGARDAGG